MNHSKIKNFLLLLKIKDLQEIKHKTSKYNLMNDVTPRALRQDIPKELNINHLDSHKTKNLARKYLLEWYKFKHRKYSKILGCLYS